jgi:hypothetical protein
VCHLRAVSNLPAFQQEAKEDDDNSTSTRSIRRLNLVCSKDETLLL